MKDIKIVNFSLKYKDEVIKLFKIVIKDSFRREGIEKENKEMNSLIQSKINLISNYLDNKDDVEKIFIAITQNKVVGIIALTEVNNIIRNNYRYNYNDTVEVSSLYVLPIYQSKGVGKALISHAFKFLKNNTKIKEYFIYSGFKIAQRFWNKLLGDPKHILINYYDNGDNCNIWHRKID